MTDKTEKSKLEQDLEGMPPEQFQKVADIVDAEKAKRDDGAFRREVANMNPNEFRDQISKSFGYTPKV